MLKFIHEYLEWKKQHRKEVQEAKLRKELLKQPLNYLLLEQFLTAFIAENQRDLKLRIKGRDFEVEVYFDEQGNANHKSRTEQIMGMYK